jgi:LCP family protein required for cell wall assembly
VSSTYAPGPPVRKRSRAARIAIAIGLVLALLVVAAGVGGYLIYRHLNSNITVDNSANGVLRKSAPKDPNAKPTDLPPENILVLGSDTRVGQGGVGGSVEAGSGGSDVIMVVHLSGDRKHALVMSFPRDTWTQIPACKQPDGTLSTPHDYKINSAYNVGGPACTIKLITQLTGVPIDHFVVVNFTGFENIVNALGGVSVCLTHAVDDPAVDGQGSGLNLSAGTHVLMGAQALEFVRLRHNIDDGSDTSRIPRQHAFIASMVRKVHEDDLLLHPLQLLNVLNAATKSITTDPGLGNVLALKDLAQSLTGLSPADVTFLTVPWYPRGDGANVLINQSEAQPIYDAIIHDTRWPLPPYAPPGPALTQAPTYIDVHVVNATGVSGRGQDVADELAAFGYRISAVTDSATTSATTYVAYPNGYPESARTLSASVVGSYASLDKTMTGNQLEVVLGTNYTSVRPVVVATPPGTYSSGSTQIVSGTNSSCVG